MESKWINGSGIHLSVGDRAVLDRVFSPHLPSIDIDIVPEQLDKVERKSLTRLLCIAVVLDGPPGLGRTDGLTSCAGRNRRTHTKISAIIVYYVGYGNYSRTELVPVGPVNGREW